MLKVVLFLSIFIIQGCKSQAVKENHIDTVYYKQFDLFNLEGRGIIKEVDKEFIEVRYKKSQPVYIKFTMPERSVTLLLVDTLIIKDNPVYIYSTSNFNGGQPGKKRVYAFHYEEHQDLIYISKCDTLITQTENIPKDGNYSFNMYVKQPNGIIEKISKGEFDYNGDNKNLNHSQLYYKWLIILRKAYLNNEIEPEIFKKIPNGYN